MNIETLKYFFMFIVCAFFFFFVRFFLILTKLSSGFTWCCFVIWKKKRIHFGSRINYKNPFSDISFKYKNYLSSSDEVSNLFARRTLRTQRFRKLSFNWTSSLSSYFFKLAIANRICTIRILFFFKWKWGFIDFTLFSADDLNFFHNWPFILID